MNKLCPIISIFLLATIYSCNEKKLNEVVEVPLPTANEKLLIGSPDDVVADEGSFTIKRIKFKYEDLEPHIDALTTEIHYSKYYLAHTNALNKAVKNTEFEKLTIEEILSKTDLNNNNLRNNAGGFYNHSMFFENIAPNSEIIPKDTLLKAIEKDFGSFENFKNKFLGDATTQFGSAWTWLIVDKNGKLLITSTQNQDNPLMPFAAVKGKPLLAMDLWEHAYYLKYQSKRKNYFNAFFNVINWSVVQDRYINSLEQ